MPVRNGATLSRILATIAVALAARAAFALEFGVDIATSNLQLPWSPLTPVTGTSFPTDNYFFGGDAWLKYSLGEDASMHVSYERDPVLRNTAIAAIQFERGITSISVGPMLGFLNSDSTPFSAGISASVKLQWPGIAYISMRSDGGTAISLVGEDADSQARTELAAGLYVPHAIVSGVVSGKRFKELDSGDDLVTDSLTRYAMTIDVYKKNVPYTALFSLGYETRSKHYDGSGTTDSLGALVLGMDASAQVDRALKLKAGISTGAYVFGLDALKNRGPGNSAFLFSAVLGMSLDLEAIPPRVKHVATAEELGIEPVAKDGDPVPADDAPATSPTPATAPEKPATESAAQPVQ
jgi:hypothetical protein